MTTSAARLDLRLDPTDKARIARAADLRGVPLSAFVRDAVLREAESVMAAELTVTLSAGHWTAQSGQSSASPLQVASSVRRRMHATRPIAGP